MLLGMILGIEFFCLVLYAGGGRTLYHRLQKNATSAPSTASPAP